MGKKINKNNLEVHDDLWVGDDIGIITLGFFQSGFRRGGGESKGFQFLLLHYLQIDVARIWAWEAVQS